MLNILALPLEVRDLVFLGHIGEDSDLSGVDGGGLIAVLAYLLVLGSSIAVLQRRYREVGVVTALPPFPACRRRPRPVRLDPAFVADATVTVQRASVWFGHKVALTELSCSFGPGVTGLLGPNGAGKTTLMRALTGLLPLNEGRVAGHGR